MIRQGVRGAEMETFTAKRPYKDVAALTVKQAKQCLTVEIQQRDCQKPTPNSVVTCRDFVDKYTATIVNDPMKTEVHVQFTRSGMGGELSFGGKFPPNGRYVMVADLTPAQGGKETKIEIYGNQLERTVPRAIRHWVNGTSQGCPDFEREFMLPGAARSTKE